MMPVAEPADQVLRLGDGRALGFRVWGDPQGQPLLFLHGTPGSRLKFSIGHERGRELGVALVAPDRWGYGLSGVPAAPSLALFAADMAALMDHLDFRRFAVGGISGGGPYATAVAACLGPRISALALISPVGPIVDAGCAGELPRFQRFAFTVLPRLPRVTAAVFGIFRCTLGHTPRLAAELATMRSGPADKAIIRRPPTGPRLLESFREGLRPGLRGPITDLAIFSQAWGLNLAAIAAPTRLWLGTADTAVPLGAARALAARIDGCIRTELAGEGHLWVAANYSQVLDWIAGTMREHSKADV
jgi:pimeloyl-ACP methyl ester carboxylesterase